METKAEKQAKLSKINSIFLANIEQKFKTLNQIIKENSDLSAELNLEEYQNYLNKISQEINFENSENSKTQNDNQNNKNIDFLIGNTSDLPDYSKTPNTLKNSLYTLKFFKKCLPKPNTSVHQKAATSNHLRL